MSDAEPTTWELQRVLLAMREDMRDEFRGLRASLDRVVSVEVFRAHQEEVVRRLGEERAERERLAARLEAIDDRADAMATDVHERFRKHVYLILTAVVAPTSVGVVLWTLAELSTP